MRTGNISQATLDSELQLLPPQCTDKAKAMVHDVLASARQSSSNPANVRTTEINANILGSSENRYRTTTERVTSPAPSLFSEQTGFMSTGAYTSRTARTTDTQRSNWADALTWWVGQSPCLVVEELTDIWGSNRSDKNLQQGQDQARREGRDRDSMGTTTTAAGTLF